jgi:hypothetical protein
MNKDCDRAPVERTVRLTISQAMDKAKEIAQGACNDVFAQTGVRPHYEVYGNRVLIVWPDGEVTNEIEVSSLQ